MVEVCRIAVETTEEKVETAKGMKLPRKSELELANSRAEDLKINTLRFMQKCKNIQRRQWRTSTLATLS